MTVSYPYDSIVNNPDLFVLFLHDCFIILGSRNSILVTVLLIAIRHYDIFYIMTYDSISNLYCNKNYIAL